MGRIIKKISGYATGRNVIAAGAVDCFAIIIMLIFFLPRIERYISQPILDLTFNYSPEYVYNLLEALGPEGRKFYIFSEFLDFVYLAIYTVFFTLLAAYLFKKAGAEGKFLFKLILLPPTVGLFDICENICFLNLLFTFPERNDMLAQAANVFTMSKWLTFKFVGLMILAGLVMIIFRRFVKGKKG